MLIEQIIEFKLTGSGLPGSTCPPTTDYFYDKTKISRKSLCGLLFTAKILRRCTLLSFAWAKSLSKFNPKMQDFKRVLDLNCK